VRRDRDAWHASFAFNHSDVFVAIGSPMHGYARLYRESSELLDICELVLRDPHDALPALRALAGLALDLGCRRMHGWFPLTDELRPWFVDAGRAKRLPMVRGYSDLMHSQFWSSDYF
jgi:hypothetical protein